jgi:DNA-binding response OmpR family regulator
LLAASGYRTVGRYFMDRTQPRALVIDDEQHLRSLLCELLTLWGVRADAAANAVDALRLFERGAYDMVLTDLVMPGVSGLDLIRSVRQRNSRVGVIMLTASAADLEGERERLGFTLLHKPVDLRGLEAAVRQALALPAS